MVDTASRTDSTPAPKIERPTTAARASEATPAHTPIDSSATPVVDVAALGRQLLGTWPESRLAARQRAADPAFQRIEGQTMAEHRERVLGQLKLLAESGAVHKAFPKELGGADDHGGNIAAFEELVLADPSLQIKSGVQWGLFGAALPR
jgi:acyl-CoA oxidase